MNSALHVVYHEGQILYKYMCLFFRPKLKTSHLSLCTSSFDVMEMEMYHPVFSVLTVLSLRDDLSFKEILCSKVWPTRGICIPWLIMARLQSTWHFCPLGDNSKGPHCLWGSLWVGLRLCQIASQFNLSLLFNCFLTATSTRYCYLINILHIKLHFRVCF